jgi:hypothetical protein
MSMALTREFNEARAARDAAFRKRLLQKAVDCMLAGEVDIGKTVLRYYVNATIGFDALGAATHKSPKALMRMLGLRGNPQARNLFEIVVYLQKNEGLRLTAAVTLAAIAFLTVSMRVSPYCSKQTTSSARATVGASILPAMRVVAKSLSPKRIPSTYQLDQTIAWGTPQPASLLVRPQRRFGLRVSGRPLGPATRFW